MSFRDVKIKPQIGNMIRGLAEVLRQVPHMLGADGKVSIERLCHSPYVEKPFNSNVIKSFVPELRSRKCFSCFEIPMLSIYMSNEHSMYISHIRIIGNVTTDPLELIVREGFWLFCQ